jgi:hypothetical protein
MRDFIKLKDFNGVAQGQNATLDIAPGPTFHGLWIEYKESGALAAQADMETDITRIQLKLNGKVQREYSAAQLFKILAAYGIPVTTGYIYIPFSEPWARTPDQEDALAWGTAAGVESFQVRVEIVTGATSPELSAFAEVDYIKRPIGLIKKFRSNVVPITKTGINNYTPEIEPLDAYAAMHAFSSNITAVEVETDRVEHFEGSKTVLDALYKAKGFTPQTGVTHILFNNTLRTTHALPMQKLDAKGNPSGKVGQFNVDFDMSSAASFTLISETIGRPD